MDFSAVLSAFEAGGDIGVLVILWMIWRLERRILHLEITLGHKK